MTSKQYTKKFKLDMDGYDISDEIPDKDFREDRQEMRLEKLSQRVTLITILIPILIAVIVVVSYLDIKEKVVQTQTTGTLGVQNLSKDLESRFSSLSVRQAKLDDQMAKLTETLDKDWGEYAVQKKKLEDKLSALAQKTVDKKELSDEIRKLSNSLKNMQEELATAQSTIETLEASSIKNFGQITAFNDEVQEKFEVLSKTVSDLTENKLDRNQLELNLKIRDLKIQEQVQEQAQDIEKEIVAIKEKTAQLSEGLNSALDQIKKISKTSTGQAAKKPASPSTSKSTPSQKDKRVVEQDLN